MSIGILFQIRLARNLGGLGNRFAYVTVFSDKIYLSDRLVKDFPHSTGQIQDDRVGDQGIEDIAAGGFRQKLRIFE